MEALLKVSSLSGGYNREKVIDDISFNVNKGDFLGIIGPNGSGKTTLLRLLSRILSPHQGIVEFEGRNILSIKLKEFTQKVAFVAQDTTVNFPFTVWEIALLGRIPHLKRLQFESKKDYQVVEQSLSMTDTLQIKQKGITEISSGERQRVIIAKALAQEPILLFLDEPTSHLDIGHQIQVLDLLGKLNRDKKVTIVVILHDLNLAAEYCNRIILLDQGRIFSQGKPKDVLTYQNIEAVYKTIVVVEENPISHNPHVMLIKGRL